MEFCIYNTILNHFSGLLYTSAQLLKEAPDLKQEDIKKSVLTWEEAAQLVQSKKRLIRIQKKETQKLTKTKKKKQD